jgi:hypothetical protein
MPDTSLQEHFRDVLGRLPTGITAATDAGHPLVFFRGSYHRIPA